MKAMTIMLIKVPSISKEDHSMQKGTDVLGRWSSELCSRTSSNEKRSRVWSRWTVAVQTVVRVLHM